MIPRDCRDGDMHACYHGHGCEVQAMGEEEDTWLRTYYNQMSYNLFPWRSKMSNERFENAVWGKMVFKLHFEDTTCLIQLCKILYVLNCLS